jgi:hypothetical protein
MATDNIGIADLVFVEMQECAPLDTVIEEQVHSVDAVHPSNVLAGTTHRDCGGTVRWEYESGKPIEFGHACCMKCGQVVTVKGSLVG